MRLKKSLLKIGKATCSVVQFNFTAEKDKILFDPLKKEVAIKAPGKSILYLTKKTSKLTKDNLNVNLLSKRVNKFYIISLNNDDFQFRINEESFDSSAINRKLTTKDIEDLLYTLAYEKYYHGNSEEALEILINSLKDKYLLKLIANSFTPKERQNCVDILFRAAHNRKVNIKPRIWSKARLMEGEIENNELDEDIPCLLKLLEKFGENRDKFIPVNSKKYKRIGKKVIDNYNAFKSDNSVKLIADFKDLVYTKNKLNISIRYEIPGFVTINPRQAKAVGFKTNVFSSKIYREQTIIKDGELNLDTFKVLVSKDTLNYLETLKIQQLFTTIEDEYYSLAGYTLLQINATKIPVLNRGYILKNDSLDYLLDTYYHQRESECKQKVIKYFIEKQIKNIKVKDKQYSKQQVELLESYGLDFKGVYRGIDNKLVTELTDQYQYRIFELALKGFSTLPKMEDLFKKINEGKKRLNGPETIMKDYIQYLREHKFQNSIEMLNKLLEEEKAIIKNNTRILAEIKLAKSLTGSWWQGLRLDSKGNYCYERVDKTLIIKLDSENK